MQKVLIPGSNRNILSIYQRKTKSSTGNKLPIHYIKTNRKWFFIEAIKTVSFNDASFPFEVTSKIQ